MNSPNSNLFSINDAQYDATQLPPEGQRLYKLLGDAQNELTRLETQKALLQAAQQELINQLKPLLPKTQQTIGTESNGVQGHASKQIPTTPAIKPEGEPAAFPQNIPNAIRRKR